MHMHTAAAARRLGTLIGGNEGRDLVGEGDAWAASQKVRDFGRMTAVLAPGWRD
jgi:hypothetical protein